MEEQPSKRRKTSPTTSIPIDAPTTPSRIPVPKPATQTLSTSRPSFASPTKASLARHNPHLLNRPTSSGTGAKKNLDDVFARALGEVRPSVEEQSFIAEEDVLGGENRSESTTQENEPDTQTIMQNRRRRSRSIGGGMAQKPRRISQSPIKKADKIIEPKMGSKADKISEPMWGPEADVNPFVKRGLRRTPPLSSQAEDVIENGLNPFKKTGLRRSPVGSTQPVGESQKENEVSPEVENTPTEPLPHTSAAEIARKPALRRSPAEPSQPTEDSQLKSLQVDDFPAIRRKTRSSRSPVGSSQLPESNQVKGLQAEKHPTTGRRTRSSRSPVLSSPGKGNQNELQSEQQPMIQRRGGLRRSPIGSQPANISQNALQAEEYPTIPRRAGLRRSPVGSQPIANSQKENLNDEVEPDISTTPTEPISSSVPEIVKETQSQEMPIQSPRQASQLAKSRMAEISPIKPKPKPTRQEEPDLPPTPKQLGIADPVVTTPPAGIHDTPSKRARRSKALSEKLHFSPLKPPPLKPSDPPPPPANKVTSQEPSKALPGILKRPSKELESGQESQSKPAPKRRKSARFLIPEDPHAAKKKERDELLQELQRLQADVALANAENERLRHRSEAKGKAKGPATAVNQAEVIEMLRRVTAPPRSSIPKEKPKSIFKSIDAFLPFKPKRVTTRQKETLSEAPLPSHLPLVLDDPLPYLQAFTPLTWSSTITIPSSSTSTQTTSSTNSNVDHAVLQKHVLTASHPQGLFSSRLSLTVHTPSLTIQDIMILRLPMCAEHELGSFIRPKARAEGPLGGNVGVITWAMGRWCDVSIKRAGIWCAIESQLGTVEARRKTFQSSRKRKRHRETSVADGHTKDQELEDEVLDTGKVGQWSRKQLLPHFGRSSMDLSSDDVELRFEWRLGFDWTGEVESKLSATARLPQTWYDQDERSSLSKIPEMFDRLVKEQGPLGAARAVVSLLMGSD